MKYGRMAVAGLLILAACSGNTVKTTLGLDRGTPDEFRVLSRPPLSVPPQFDLRPPESAADASLNQIPTTNQAQALLTGAPAANDVTVGKAVKAPPAASKADTTAESVFLHNVGADQADPKIRQEIVNDQIAAQAPPPEETSWWNFWSSSTPTKTEPLVNASGESQRIKTDENTGQPVTAGDTPTVKQKDTGLLGTIFGY